MIIFLRFEHFSLLTSTTNQIKIHFARNYISTLITSCSSNTSHSLTCPKTWGKGPKRLKTLKMINFHSFEHVSLPTLLMKQNKNNWARNCMWHTCYFGQFEPKSFLNLPKNLGKRTKTAKNTKKWSFLVSLSTPPC